MKKLVTVSVAAVGTPPTADWRVLLPQTRTARSDAVMVTTLPDTPVAAEAVPEVTENELLVGKTAQTGLGRTAKGPAARVTTKSFRSDNRSLDAWFMI